MQVYISHKSNINNKLLNVRFANEDQPAMSQEKKKTNESHKFQFKYKKKK